MRDIQRRQRHISQLVRASKGGCGQFEWVRIVNPNLVETDCFCFLFYRYSPSLWGVRRSFVTCKLQTFFYAESAIKSVIGLSHWDFSQCRKNYISTTCFKFFWSIFYQYLVLLLPRILVTAIPNFKFKIKIVCFCEDNKICSWFWVGVLHDPRRRKNFWCNVARPKKSRLF